MLRSWTTCKRRWKTDTKAPYKAILYGVFLCPPERMICNVLALQFANNAVH